MRIASFDIGSNTVLMLIAERSDTGWVRVADHMAITRISEGLDRSGVLAPAAVARTASVVTRFVAEAKAAGVTTILATGTAPFRRSANGEAVATELSKVLGTGLRVVSGEQEARLALLATRASFPDLTRLAVVDIGGASTEVVLLDEKTGGVPSVYSLDVGSVRLTERCTSSDPITADERQAVRRAIDDALDESGLAPIFRQGRWPLVGIAGTVTTLAAIDLGLEAYAADRVHGYRLKRGTLDALADRLFELPLATRKSVPGLEPERADVIPAGAEILRAVASRAGSDEIVVSDRGVRWGRLYEEMR